MDILQRAVGPGAPNQRHDVLLVQMLLNQNMGALIPRARLSVDGVCGPNTMDAIRDYQQRKVRLHAPDGRIDPGGRTLRSLLEWSSQSVRLGHVVRAVQAVQSTKAAPIVPVDKVAPGGGKDQKFTTDPNEVVTTKTPPPLAGLVDALKKAWPDLTVDGSHTLAAQCMHETGGGKHCYNWNFGNVKSPSTTNLHMYLRGVWECGKSAKLAEDVASSKGLGRLATAEEIKKHGWGCPGGQGVIVYSPPSKQCRFRAYNSMAEGAVDWTNRYKRTATRHKDFLASLNKGDTAAFAKTLADEHYYTGSEKAYANNMKSAKEKIDKTLGMK